MTRQKIWYERNKDNPSYIERKRANKKKWNKANVERVRAYDLKRNYGITIEDYNSLLLKQNNSCAICGVAATIGKKRLHVDHSHITNRVRGLLCQNCNRRLGWLEPNLNKTIEYLASNS